MLTRPTPAQQSFVFMDTPPSAFNVIEKPDLASYDHILIAFSGGKDSLACVLHLLEEGADPAKIELWHHDIDGHEGGPRLMDWPCTPSYCEAVAKALGLPIFFSWRRGGFLGEMMRQNAPTAAVTFQSPDGEFTTGGKSKDLGTRLRFPQVAADLQTRWCSAYDYRRTVNMCSASLVTCVSRMIVRVFRCLPVNNGGSLLWQPRRRRPSTWLSRKASIPISPKSTFTVAVEAV